MADGGSQARPPHTLKHNGNSPPVLPLELGRVRTSVCAADAPARGQILKGVTASSRTGPSPGPSPESHQSPDTGEEADSSPSHHLH